MINITIISNSLSNVLLRREKIIKKLINNNFKITIIAENDLDKFQSFEKCDFFNLNFRTSKFGIFKNLMIFFKLTYILLNIKSSNILCFQIKPIFFVSIINFFLKKRVINTFTGLGSVLLKNSFLKNLILLIFRITLKKKDITNIYQNSDDLEYFLKNGIIKKISIKILL